MKHVPPPLPESSIPHRLSVALRVMRDGPLPERVTIADLTRALGRRGHVALMLVFAALNVIPMPPGTSLLLGAPLAILAWGFSVGQPPWLPAFIERWAVSDRRCRDIIDRILPGLERAERAIRPRGARYMGPNIDRISGWIIFLLSLTIMIPLPFTAILPALAVCIMTLGLIERDAAWLAVGALVSALAALVLVSVISGLSRVLMLLLIGN